MVKRRVSPENFNAFLLRWVPKLTAVFTGFQIDAAIFAAPRTFCHDVLAIDRNDPEQRPEPLSLIHI